MSVEQEEEIQSLLWSYQDIISDDEERKRTQEVKDFFRKNKIPITDLPTMFKQANRDLHYKAVYVASKIACGDILRARPGVN